MTEDPRRRGARRQVQAPGPSGRACSPAVGKLRFMGSNATGNPYRPGRGVAPPVLAGRSSVLDIAEERLDVLAAGGMPPQDLLLYGPRGNGKTTLLIEIERRARERGLRVEELPVDALTTRERLVRHLQERAGLWRGRLTGVQVAGVGATADRAAPSEEIGQLFRAWIGTDEIRPLVIVMDEIHALSPEAARPFFDAVQTAKNGGQPFLLLAAGTPDAPRRVREAATYNERGFRTVRVGRLQRPETITALAEPARMSGHPMSADAAALLAEESQDYPYFIQLLGRATWKEAAEVGSGIGLDAARRGLAASRVPVERFFSGRYDEAWSRKIASALEPLATLFVDRKGRLPQFELRERLVEIAAPDSFPLDEVALLDTLRDLGVVWEASPGVWEMGIPSFADFVLRHARPEP